MSRYCSLPECDSKHFAKGLCKRHYLKEWREKKLGRQSSVRKSWTEEELMALRDLLKARVIPAPRPLTHGEIAGEMRRRFGEHYESRQITAKLTQLEAKGAEEWRRRDVKRKPRGGRPSSAQPDGL